MGLSGSYSNPAVLLTGHVTFSKGPLTSESRFSCQQNRGKNNSSTYLFLMTEYNKEHKSASLRYSYNTGKFLR
jgi:hypothetical protein